MHYAHNLWRGLNVFGATIVVLGFFALLNLIGIAESAVFALLIFLFHILTLSVLSIAGMWTVLETPQLLMQNWAARPQGNVLDALFFGFCAAMLGISGFESSANFIEEQRPGVFPKTLRNMWLGVMIFNPLISLLSLGLLPLALLRTVPPDMLAMMGERSAGHWLGTLVSVDAVLVLSGAVLTSYVGVTGLVQRMTLDRCLPGRLLRTNRWRGTNHWIIIGFFLVCCSILVVTRGDVGSLAAVYTLSFLCVMALFAIGNMLLKVTRARLPREAHASWFTVVLALICVLFGLAGNVLLNHRQVGVFVLYFACAAAVVLVMLLRVPLFRLVLFVSGELVERTLAFNRRLSRSLGAKIAEINKLEVVYFTRGDAPEQLNRAVQYVLRNEQTSHLIVVHVYSANVPIPERLAEQLSQIDRRYPSLRIDFVAVEGTFGPELIQRLSERLNVPKNYMFIGTPSDRFPHRIDALGGVRLVL
jgi:amino acid transporter